VHRLPREVLRKRDRHRTSTKSTNFANGPRIFGVDFVDITISLRVCSM